MQGSRTKRETPIQHKVSFENSRNRGEDEGGRAGECENKQIQISSSLDEVMLYAEFNPSKPSRIERSGKESLW